MNWLFICSKNRWRSLTAEKMFRNLPDYTVRSAGTDSDARVRVSAKLLKWADQIFVMEQKHLELLKLRFKAQIANKKIEVLNIPDEYHFNEPELRVILIQSMVHFLLKNDDID